MSRTASPDTYNKQEKYLLELCKGKRIREISKETGTPMGTITGNLTRMRQSLKLKNNVQLAARIVFGMEP